MHNAAAPALGRGDRRVHRPGEDRPRRARPTCCAATSPARSSRSTPSARSVRGVRAYAVGHRHPGRGRPRRGRRARGRHRRACSASCLAKGVTALVVVTAGFARDRRRTACCASGAWSTAARAHGMRVVGPNALGVANTDPDGAAQRHARPATCPAAGRVGFFCQSGALGIAILAAAARARARPVHLRLGRQPRRRVRQRPAAVLADRPGHRRGPALPGDVRQPAQVRPARPAARAHQADRRGEERAAHAVRSRRSPRSAGRSTTPACGALFEQAGVIRVDTLAELFDAALLLAHQPLPAGPRVAVVGNSTALGVLVADALLGEGLQLAGDPVDVGVTAAPEDVRCRRRRRARPRGRAAVDAGSPGPPTRSSPCSCRRSPPRAPPTPAPCARRPRCRHRRQAGRGGVPRRRGRARRARRARRGRHARPRLGAQLPQPGARRGGAGPGEPLRARGAPQPAGDFTPPPGIDGDAARELVARVGGRRRPSAPQAGRRWPTPSAAALLACYGITLVESRRVADAEATRPPPRSWATPSR